MTYNWQHDNWPDLEFDLRGMQGIFIQFAEKTGRVDGLYSALPDELQSETFVDLMVAEAIKSSEIEGEVLSRPDVMSSLKQNLGLTQRSSQVGDRRAAGFSDLLVEIRSTFAQPLDQQMLFKWHHMLMRGSPRVNAGAWRTHTVPMLIVSGTLGDEQVHFEAPPSKRVPAEMKRFIRWFNQTAPDAADENPIAPVRAALAHLTFESIHPFEDGNGRMGRALSEKALSQGLGRPVLLSLSRSIAADRAGYYTALKRAQRTLDATEWIEWFVHMLLDAQMQVETEIEFTIKKTNLFDRWTNHLNDRQLKAVRRMLKEGPEGFEGGMSAKKYSALTRTSKATATRDLQDLVKKGIFIPMGSGRSTHYAIRLE